MTQKATSQSDFRHFMTGPSRSSDRQKKHVQNIDQICLKSGQVVVLICEAIRFIVVSEITTQNKIITWLVDRRQVDIKRIAVTGLMTTQIIVFRIFISAIRY